MTSAPTSAPLEQLRTALTATGGLVAAVAPGQWTAPTPCSDWTVRDLVDHVVFGNRLFAAVLGGEPMPPMPEVLRRQAEDHLGDDAAAAYDAAADELLTACAAEGALDQLVRVPIGEVPGALALHLRVVEALVHGWDLARATGTRLEVPAELVEGELAFTRARLGDLPPGRTPFGPAQPVADDASPLDRLAAALGRRTTWPGDG
jgi:uncharacterized protein (TIGR03086 family)